jgi:hypothetical protein
VDSELACSRLADGRVVHGDTQIRQAYVFARRLPYGDFISLEKSVIEGGYALALAGYET